MQNFVNSRKGQADNYQNAQPPVNPARQAIAANAKVHMKPHIARPHPAKGSQSRGEGVAEHQFTPAPQQQSQQLQRQPSNESRKQHPWDTDGESIDTTINDSVVQVENSQQHGQPELQFNIEDSEAGEGEVSGSDEFDEDAAPFNSEVGEYLLLHNMADVTQEQQMQFLQRTQPQLFPTVDGDSYPTTTDGNPTEWDEQQEPHSQDLVSPSLSPELIHPVLNHTLANQQTLQTTSNIPHASPAVPQSTHMWQQGAQLRAQQRNEGAIHIRGHSGQHDRAVYPSTSQPPTYSQATDEYHLIAPSTTHALIESVATNLQEGQFDVLRRPNRTPTGPDIDHNPASRIVEPSHPLRQASTARAQVVPVIQTHAEPTLAPPQGDYDPDALSQMNYEYLRDENFDKDPRGCNAILPKEMRDTPLPERLQYAQHELDPFKQSEFFSMLPTNEWEDAGDWFLDQFSAVMQKTRKARQNKRKAAQGFEQEIELRHRHIAKKERIVKDAMAKMQAQGEGLVPKSPRASKSPRPRIN